jgi:hypothetical protein
VAESLEQAPFTSEIVGSILATDPSEKSQSTLYRKSWVFSGRSGFLSQEMSTVWVRINTVKGHWQPKFLLLHLKEHEKISRLAV